jgi:hypothetical protein
VPRWTPENRPVEGLQTEVDVLEQEVTQRQAAKAHLDQECERQAGGLAVVRALQAFLLGKTAEAEALWTTLEALLVWRRKGGRVDSSVGPLFTDGVKQKMLAFFQQLIRDPPLHRRRWATAQAASPRRGTARAMQSEIGLPSRS